MFKEFLIIGLLISFISLSYEYEIRISNTSLIRSAAGGFAEVYRNNRRIARVRPQDQWGRRVDGIIVEINPHFIRVGDSYFGRDSGVRTPPPSPG
jgi:hypothetical protein